MSTCRVGCSTFADQIHKLVKFRRNNNLSTPVPCSAIRSIVAGNRVVLAAAPGCKALRIQSIIIMPAVRSNPSYCEYWVLR